MRKVLLFGVFALLAGCLVVVQRVSQEEATTKKQQTALTGQEWFKKRQELKKAYRDYPYAKLDQPGEYAKLHRAIRTRDGEDGPGYTTGYLFKELQKMRQQRAKRLGGANSTEAALDFIERGPGNVPGRTRGMIVMPQDPTNNTWLAGSVGGGIWKTTDAGQTWTNKTVGIPNLATTWLDYSAANPDVIYAATGESFAGDGINGSGLLKSTDGGETWSLLPSTTNIKELENINRVIVDPGNPDIVVICGRQSNFAREFASGIFRSTDGGETWTQTYEGNSTVQQVIYTPGDFNTQYAAIFSSGVIKSTDGGVTWTDASVGLFPSGRLELAVAPTDPNRIYASAEGNISGSGGSDMYVSFDAGANWSVMFEENDGTNFDHLGGQGGYDNTILVSPFDEDIVYAAGVNVWKFEVTEGTSDGVPLLKSVDTVGTGSFLDFVSFGGGFFGGQVDFGNANASQFVSVEVRFGPGLSQKAHRFTVGSQGAGVPPGGYIYQDYVDVPFQVWDIDNNRQLMVSFRDQQENGTFELIEQNTDGDGSTHSREYVFIQAVEYSETPDPNIAQDGSVTTGHEYQQLYFFWPVLAAGGTFDGANLPEATMTLDYGTIEARDKVTTNISDAYFDFSQRNTFSNQEFESQVGGVHPDHHNLLAIVDDANAGTFRILNCNDGGVYITESSTDPGFADGSFLFAGAGYNTSQFYGADKRPGTNQYIGGMQDNSTWFTPDGVDANANTPYKFAMGGDGFEAVWNRSDPNKMIGSIQFNQFRRSLDGGQTFSGATSGMTDVGSGVAPFVSRLSDDPQDPDRLYAIGASGVWTSNDFGGSWALTPITNDYALEPRQEVKPSLANSDIVWAGGAMLPNSKIHVSTDRGASFTPTNNYDQVTLGNIAGFATHPTEPNTAYALFSFQAGPKILRTTDLGQTWEDISGFNDGEVSTNGYPDLGTFCLLVLPFETNTIWAGTDLGIIESTDNGATWHPLDCNLPATSVWDLKFEDNQVVVATHGRGIWSVTFSDVAAAPAVLRAFTRVDKDLGIEASFLNDYDSVDVLIDGNAIGTLYGVTAGRVNITTTFNGGEGSFTVQLTAYLGGQALTSNELTGEYIQLGTVSDKYSSDFEDSPAADFTGTGFSFQQPTGFVDVALHSEHIYLPSTNDSWMLRTPIVVDNDTAIITYKDVAIVEPGEAGSTFGETAFYDYVVVEGTTDGVNWTPLAPGYDASANADWLDTWNNNRSGRRQLFVDQSINLLDTYNTGDTILIRFRLFADGGTQGWGWAIDDLNVQVIPDEVTGFDDDVLNNQLALSVYPVPVARQSTIQFNLPRPSEVNIRLLTVSGQTVEQISLGRQPQGQGSVQWQSSLAPGIYLVSLETQNGIKTQRIYVQ